MSAFLELQAAYALSLFIYGYACISTLFVFAGNKIKKLSRCLKVIKTIEYTRRMIKNIRLIQNCVRLAIKAEGKHDTNGLLISAENYHKSRDDSVFHYVSLIKSFKLI